jgi:hypothetical protein
MNIKQRIERLERLKGRHSTGRVSFWDILCGAIPAEGVAPEDIQGWAEIEPALREAIRAGDEDPIEARLQQVAAQATAPNPVSPDNHHEL